jgi:hypothetical protein
MSTKFAALVQEKKLNTNRLLAVSSELKKRQVKATVAAGGDVDKNAPPPAKPRTGRPITPRAIAAALAGKPLTGPQKTRLLKAVNALLEKKKQAPVELSALF